MKLEIYEEEALREDCIKIWFTPQTPEETLLLDKLKERLGKIDPGMLKFIADWWQTMKGKKPMMLLKFPKCWEKN